MSKGMPIRLVSLDTSTTRTGWAYFENAELVDSGVIICEKEKDTVIRQENMIIAILHDILDKFKPDIVVIERPPFINSPKTLVDLAEIVGAVRGRVMDRAEYVEYWPNEWRKLVAAPDEAIPRKRMLCKEWDIQKVRELFRNVSIVDDNHADAILIGKARCNEIDALCY